MSLSSGTYAFVRMILSIAHRWVDDEDSAGNYIAALWDLSAVKGDEPAKSLPVLWELFEKSRSSQDWPGWHPDLERRENRQEGVVSTKPSMHQFAMLRCLLAWEEASEHDSPTSLYWCTDGLGGRRVSGALERRGLVQLGLASNGHYGARLTAAGRALARRIKIPAEKWSAFTEERS